MKKIILLFLLQLSALAFAQPGSLDTTFDPGTGASGFVLATSLQSDGKIMIGGNFSSYNGTTARRIARLNADGSLDTSFNPGTGVYGAYIAAIAVQKDGKIIIAGDFWSFDGVTRRSIVRLNTDGSLDKSFNLGAKFNNSNSYIEAIAIQSDGKIIIGGSSSEFSGITRLNTDGSFDKSFNPGTGASSLVHCLTLQSDGKIILGGLFTGYNNINRNYIARINADGSLDTSFNPGTGGDFQIRTTSIQWDGKIIIGGEFTSFNNISRKHIARLNADGSLDLGFDPGAGVIYPSDLFATAVQPDGKILIGGYFLIFDGVNKHDFARLNADGSLDQSFNSDANNFVRTISLQADGKIIIGGHFNTYNGTARCSIARLKGDTLPPIASAQILCDGATVANLVASGINLKWYTSASDITSLASTTALNTGTYYVSQTEDGVESGRTAVPVTVNNPVVPTFTPLNAICQGATLQALPVVSNNGISGTWPTLDNTKTTTYTFTPTAGQCATFANMTITVNPIVTTTFNPIGPICAGTALALLTTSDNSVTGTWSPAMNNAATTNYTFTPSAGSCGTVATMVVEVNALPDIESDYTKIICSGNNEEVPLNAGLLSGLQSNYSYEWFKDGKLWASAKDYNLTVETEGVYTCVVKDKSTGCEKTRTNTVTYSETIKIKEVVVADLTEHNLVMVESSNAANSEFSLDNPTGPFQDSNVFENVPPGMHTVYVKDKKGCGFVSKAIGVVGAPLFFTPNGDGYNETWKVEGISASYLRNTRVDIFDRFGKLLKVIPNAESDGWDGTYNGYNMPSNDYWFVAHLEDGRQGRGHFALKR